jgi:hypothetical protein
MSFGEHGRELITTELALRVLDDLGGRYTALLAASSSSSSASTDTKPKPSASALSLLASGSGGSGAAAGATELDRLLPYLAIKLIPMVRSFFNLHITIICCLLA